MSKFPMSHDDFSNDPEYYEELTILKAQERISLAMENAGVTKADLARKINKSKAFVTRLLSDGHNMTIRTYSNILFHLGEEARFLSRPIEKKEGLLFTFKPKPKIIMRSRLKVSDCESLSA